MPHGADVHDDNAQRIEFICRVAEIRELFVENLAKQNHEMMKSGKWKHSAPEGIKKDVTLRVRRCAATESLSNH